MDISQNTPTKDGGSSKQKKNKPPRIPEASQIKSTINPPLRSPGSVSIPNVKKSLISLPVNQSNANSQDGLKSAKGFEQDETPNSQKKRHRHNKKKGVSQEVRPSGEGSTETVDLVSNNNPCISHNRTLVITPILEELLLKEKNSLSEKVSPSPTKSKFPEGSLLSDNKLNKDSLVKSQSTENGPRTVSENTTTKAGLKLENTVDHEDTGTQKSKAEMRRERRILQEAQRAAKASGKLTSGVPSAKKITALPTTAQQVPRRVSDSLKLDDEKVQKKIAKKLEKQQIPQRTTVQKKVGLFSHLYQYEREVSLTQGMQFSSTGIHPAILKLGLQYAEGVTCGSNARCIALLSTFKKVIADYVTPPQKDLSRDLEAKIKPYINFLTQCRPLSVSMSNAIKYIKWHITHIPREMTDAEAKSRLYENIDNFYKEKIILADEAISKNFAFVKINDGDVILTYAFSSLVCKVLCDAYDKGKKFQVIVADSRPKMEGQEMLRRLIRHGIQCSYILISSVSYIMREVSKVFMGAHALQANGYVMSRVGSSQIALVAKAYNVPVLVCCETYKFCERVQTDAFVCNELGDPDDLVATNTKDAYLSDWRDIPQLNLLNLVYDVTPPDLVAMVITELGMLPCTSVPVVLRVKHAETSDI